MVGKKLEHSSSFERKQPTPGVQEARILRVVDLGVRKQEFKGERKPDRTVLSFTFELADDKVEIKGEEKPMVVFKSVNFVGGEKAALTKLCHIAGLDPRGELDFTKFLGAPVSVELTKKPNGKVYVTGFSGVSERVAQTVPPLVSDSYFFDFDDPDPDILLKKMGEGMHRMLKEALNYEGSKVEKLLTSKEEPEDEVM